MSDGASLIARLLDRLSRHVSSVFFSTKLRPIEAMVLEAWRASLSEHNRVILDAQLASAKLIQRQAGGAKLCWYYSKYTRAPTFDVPQAIAHVATVVLKSAGNERKQLAVKLWVVSGRFFSIEFPKRPARYLQLNDMDPDCLYVAEVVKVPGSAV